MIVCKAFVLLGSPFSVKHKHTFQFMRIPLEQNQQVVYANYLKKVHVWNWSGTIDIILA